MAPSSLRSALPALAVAFAAVCLISVAPAASQSLPLVPGLSTGAGAQGAVFNHGYDPITGDVKGRVVEYTYNNMNGDNNQWTDPESGKTFSLPDQVVMADVPASQTSYSQQIFASLDEWYKYEQSESWSSFSIIVVSFSSASMNAYVREQIKFNAKEMAHSFWVATTYKAQLWPTPVLVHEMQSGCLKDSIFVKEQMTLPSSRSTADEVAAYDGFIAKYGTHLMTEMFAGGVLHAFLQINSSYVATHSSSESAHYSAFAFDIIFVSFGFMSGSGHYFSKISSDFKASTSVALIAYGGETALIDTGVYSSWLGTVHTNPAPINATYISLTDLIIDGTVAGHLQDAITEYLGKPNAFLNNQRCATCLGKGLGIDDLPHTSVSTNLRLGNFQAEVAPRKLSESPNFFPEDSSTLPIIPGYDSGVGHGYDVKTGTLKDAVSELTFNDNQMYYNGYLDTTYRIPDGLAFADIPSACFVERISEISNASAAAQFLASMTGFEIGISFDGIGIGVSFMHEMAKFKALTQDYTSDMSLMSRAQTLYKLQYGSLPSQLNKEFEEVVNALPTTPSPLYQQFIDYWGTHFVAGSDFGSYCNFTSVYLKTFVKETSAAYAQTQVEISFGLELESIGMNIDIGYGLTHITGSLSEKFLASSNTTWMCVGGDVDLLKAKQFDQWVDSVLHDPALIPSSIQLRPLSMLIYDPTKRQLLQDAIVDYLKA